MIILENGIDTSVEFPGKEVEKVQIRQEVTFYQKILDTFFQSSNVRILWPEADTRNSISICEKSPWALLDEFLFDKEIFVFFDNPNNNMYRLKENSSKSFFLKKIQFYTFYITNESLDFLIYFNDANYLCAIGTAEPWLRNKAIELSKTGWKDADGFYWDENGTKLR